MTASLSVRPIVEAQDLPRVPAAELRERFGRGETGVAWTPEHDASADAPLGALGGPEAGAWPYDIAAPPPVNVPALCAIGEAWWFPRFGALIGTDGALYNATIGEARHGSQDLSAIPGLREGAVVGGQLPKTAKWSLNLSPRYELGLANGGTLVLLADWTYKSEVWNDVARYLPLRRPAIDIVNASITYREPGSHWDVTMGATNLTDKRYLVSAGANDAAGVYFGSYNRPREWYARLGFKF